MSGKSSNYCDFSLKKISCSSALVLLESVEHCMFNVLSVSLASFDINRRASF